MDLVPSSRPRLHAPNNYCPQSRPSRRSFLIDRADANPLVLRREPEISALRVSWSSTGAPARAQTVVPTHARPLAVSHIQTHSHSSGRRGVPVACWEGKGPCRVSLYIHPSDIGLSTITRTCAETAGTCPTTSLDHQSARTPVPSEAALHARRFGLWR